MINASPGSVSRRALVPWMGFLTSFALAGMATAQSGSGSSGSGGGGGGGGGAAALSTVRVPLPSNLATFVRDNAAAIRLGKSLFWDEQVGGDGQQACASCHFHAGVDARTTNTGNPGHNGVFDG